MRSVRDADINGKKVFLRVDFNVPFKDGKIEDNNRIQMAIPTIKYLIEKKAIIIVGTHLGRPEGKFNPEFSTIPVAEELAKLIDQKVDVTDHVLSPVVSDKINQMGPGDVLVLGNLRFHPEEEMNDEDFAKELAEYADIYVNDAFAVSHRANASVEAITKFLPSFAGLLLESETTTLNLLLDSPEHPFVVVVGGAKVKDKAGLLVKLAEKADKILIGGAVGNTFLAARGEDMSQSLIDADMMPTCKELMDKFGAKIELPIDSVKEPSADGGFRAMDIGEKSCQKFQEEIQNAKCIFWNGNLGYTEDERYLGGTKAVAEALVANTFTTVIAGGDTVGFVDKYGFRKNISFISTGGGAAMQYLSGEQLPGIEALNRNSL